MRPPESRPDRATRFAARWGQWHDVLAVLAHGGLVHLALASPPNCVTVAGLVAVLNELAEHVGPFQPLEEFAEYGMTVPMNSAFYRIYDYYASVQTWPTEAHGRDPAQRRLTK